MSRAGNLLVRRPQAPRALASGTTSGCDDGGFALCINGQCRRTAMRRLTCSRTAHSSRFGATRWTFVQFDIRVPR